MGDGKPKMSRELVERLMRTQGGSMGSSAYGGEPAQARQSHAVRRKGYRDSMLGSRYNDVRQMGAEISGGKSYDKRRNTRMMSDLGQNERIDSGQNRPSAGFKEPEGRNYNPYS